MNKEVCKNVFFVSLSLSSIKFQKKTFINRYCLEKAMKRDKKRLLASIGVIIGIVIVLLILAWAFGLFGGKRGISLAPGDCFCDSCDSCTRQLNDPLCKKVYLTRNITGSLSANPSCIYLKAKDLNKTFDCSGKTINVVAKNNGYGIRLDSIAYLNISNCKFNCLPPSEGKPEEVINAVIALLYGTFSVNLNNIEISNCNHSSAIQEMGIWIDRNVGSSQNREIGLSSIILKNYHSIGIQLRENSYVKLKDISACGGIGIPGNMDPPYDIDKYGTAIITSQSNVICNQSWGMNCSSKCPINMPGAIFVTSTAYTGNLGGIAGADAKCMARAQAGRLAGTWVALLSNSTLNMTDRTDRIQNMTYRKMDGKIIANNKADLFDGSLVINGQIDLDEFGRARAPSGWSRVWTGTSFDGKILAGRTEYCSNWQSNSTSASIAGRHGHYTQAGMQWISGGTMTCNNEYPLYCMRVS
jgi:hypothetical protein